jgi:hypothetical protein
VVHIGLSRLAFAALINVLLGGEVIGAGQLDDGIQYVVSS